MKKCPQCHNSYNDENIYCLNDGAILIDELPSTITFNYPNNPLPNPAFVVDISPKDETPTLIAPFPPRVQIASTKSESKNYVVLLLIGLLAGGGLVLGTFFLTKSFGERKTEVATNANSAKSKVNSNDEKSSATNADITSGYNNVITNSANSTEEAKPKKKGNYNGRVIMINAYLRSAPSDYATEVEVLPMDSFVKVGKRAAPNSPWYRVTSESGTNGWMHGNTIEFTR